MSKNYIVIFHSKILENIRLFLLWKIGWNFYFIAFRTRCWKISINFFYGKFGWKIISIKQVPFWFWHSIYYPQGIEIWPSTLQLLHKFNPDNIVSLEPEQSDILWHPTKMYGPKVVLLTKIKPEYSDILYNPTHFPGPLVCRIRQVPMNTQQ